MPKLHECDSLEELATAFQTKVSLLKNVVQLRDAASDPSCSKLLAEVSREVHQLNVLLTLMRADIAQKKKALVAMQSIKASYHEVNERVNHCKENIPDRMPRRQEPVAAVQTISAPPNRHQPVVASQGTQPHKPQPSASPFLEYLTVAEFQEVPKYIKGRLKYEQMNASVDEFNKALAAKHAILTTPKSAQTEKVKAKLRVYREQRTNDTKGHAFIVEDDLKVFTNLKMDTHGRSIITILRHCKRLREVRSKGLTRFVCI